MNGVTNICKSIWYTFLGLTCCAFTMQICIPLLEKCNFEYEVIGGIFFKGFDIIKVSLILFGTGFFIISTICFAIKAIYNLWMFFYYTFFYTGSKSKVQINVDESNHIVDSYMEFSNGEKVPLYITRVIGKINEEENKTDNNDVSNNEEEK